MLALKRPLFVLLAAAAALYLVHRGRGGLGLLAALAAGAGGGALHATLRSPNLKTRLTSAQQEFRAVW